MAWIGSLLIASAVGGAPAAAADEGGGGTDDEQYPRCDAIVVDLDPPDVDWYLDCVWPPPLPPFA